MDILPAELLNRNAKGTTQNLDLAEGRCRDRARRPLHAASQLLTANLSRIEL